MATNNNNNNTTPIVVIKTTVKATKTFHFITQYDLFQLSMVCQQNKKNCKEIGLDYGF